MGLEHTGASCWLRVPEEKGSGPGVDTAFIPGGRMRGYMGTMYNKIAETHPRSFTE